MEHPQALIDKIQYGAKDAEGVLRGKGALPVASYRLAATIAAPAERRPAPASGWAEDDDEGARDRPVQVCALLWKELLCSGLI